MAVKMRIKKDCNERQRQFAILVARGQPLNKAYVMAGYRPSGDGNTSTLFKSPNVQAVIKEEQERMRNECSMITKEMLIEELRNIKDEKGIKPADKVACVKQISKMLGLEENKVSLKSDGPLFIIVNEKDDITNV